MQYPEFKVCVRCFTYNQSKYIKDTLDGFAMQQTNFPFVCCIVDDASTDGEQNVIDEYVYANFDESNEQCYFRKETNYADVIYAQHRSNKNCFFTILFLKQNHFSIAKDKLEYLKEWRDYCKYEALCEGDDYWIDNNKLQYQYDFMESHPECSMCYHSCRTIFEEGFDMGPRRKTGEHVKSEYSIGEILKSYNFQTATTFFRASVMNDTLTKKITSILGHEVVLYFCACLKGRIMGIDKQMSIYRRCNQGISNRLFGNGQLFQYYIGWNKICQLVDKKTANAIHKYRQVPSLIYLCELSKTDFYKAVCLEIKYYPLYAFLAIIKIIWSKTNSVIIIRKYSD